jgi:hypothetical protein
MGKARYLKISSRCPFYKNHPELIFGDKPVRKLDNCDRHRSNPPAGEKKYIIKYL